MRAWRLLFLRLFPKNQKGDFMKSIQTYLSAAFCLTIQASTIQSAFARAEADLRLTDSSAVQDSSADVYRINLAGSGAVAGEDLIVNGAEGGCGLDDAPKQIIRRGSKFSISFNARLVRYERNCTYSVSSGNSESNPLVVRLKAKVDLGDYINVNVSIDKNGYEFADRQLQSGASWVEGSNGIQAFVTDPEGFTTFRIWAKASPLSSGIVTLSCIALGYDVNGKFRFARETFQYDLGFAQMIAQATGGSISTGCRVKFP